MAETNWKKTSKVDLRPPQEYKHTCPSMYTIKTTATKIKKKNNYSGKTKIPKMTGGTQLQTRFWGD